MDQIDSRNLRRKLIDILTWIIIYFVWRFENKNNSWKKFQYLVLFSLWIFYQFKKKRNSVEPFNWIFQFLCDTSFSTAPAWITLWISCAWHILSTLWTQFCCVAPWTTWKTTTTICPTFAIVAACCCTTTSRFHICCSPLILLTIITWFTWHWRKWSARERKTMKKSIKMNFKFRMKYYLNKQKYTPRRTKIRLTISFQIWKVKRIAENNKMQKNYLLFFRLKIMYSFFLSTGWKFLSSNLILQVPSSTDISQQ